MKCIKIVLQRYINNIRYDYSTGFFQIFTCNFLKIYFLSVNMLYDQSLLLILSALHNLCVCVYIYIYPHLPAGAPGIFSDLLRSVQMLKRVGCRNQWEATAPTHP